MKLIAFLFSFLLLNIWVSYNVNFWSFNNFEERGKVLQNPVARGRDGDNGGAVPLATNGAMVDRNADVNFQSDVQPQRSFSDFSVSRYQRSAKSFQGNRDNSDNDRGLPAVETPNLGINLLHSKTVRLRAVAAGSASNSKKIIGTNKETPTTLRDIFISVKTTSKYHVSRIRLIQKTWYALARDDVSLKKKPRDQNH